MSGDSLDVLATRLNTDPQYMWQITTKREEMLPSLLAAQKRTPEDATWIHVISMFFAADQFDAREFSPEERRERYGTALEYLQEAAKTIEAASPEAAKEYLLKSAMTAGSPQLESFGPSFVLARELLEKGEKENVLEYLDLVAEFRANPGRSGPVTPLAGRNAQEHADQLEEWREEISRGRVPQSYKWR